MNAKWSGIVHQCLFLLIVLVFISGCNSRDEGTVVVSQEQAKAVAYDVYDVTNIEEINLRHLTDDELTLLNDEQSQLTPIYYVINGSTDDQPITIYVSSNEVNHHFSK